MRRLLAVCAALAAVGAACGNDGREGADAGPAEVNVAYYLQWPAPNQVAQAEKTFDDVLGVTVNWTDFASGGDIAQAMVAGDIDIAYAMGDTPFATFVTTGADLLIVGLPSANPEADNCVANPDYGITQQNAAETLAGQRIYTPLGNVNHYKLLRMLDHLGVDADSVELIQSEGGAAAVAALASGEVALSCAFGGAINEMVAAGGHLLMTGAEMQAIGINIFDLIVTTREFAEAHPDLVTAFLQITIDANRAYRADREPMLATIAETAGMDLDAAVALLDDFTFTDRDQMLSPEWMGGGVQLSMKQQMDFFASIGEIESALDSYDQFVDHTFAEATQ